MRVSSGLQYCIHHGPKTWIHQKPSAGRTVIYNKLYSTYIYINYYKLVVEEAICGENSQTL